MNPPPHTAPAKAPSYYIRDPPTLSMSQVPVCGLSPERESLQQSSGDNSGN